MCARGLFIALIGAGVVWLALLAFCPAARQNQNFPVTRGMFQDFQIPRDCALSENPYAAESVRVTDRCYAPIGYAVARLFPASPELGGLLFTATGAVLLLLSIGLLLGNGHPDGWLVMGAVAASTPFLLAVERSNQVWLAAAGVAGFLAWFESPSACKRQLALLFLAFACALKLTPGIFALFLVKNCRWRDLSVLALETIALLLLPFLLFEGENLVGDWVSCTRLHLKSYARTKQMGLERLLPSVSHWLVGGSLKGWLLAAGRLADVVLGLVSVIGFFACRSRAREILLLTGAMLLVPSVSQHYTYLYVLAAFVLSANRGISLLEAGLWLVLLCPLVIPFHTWALNAWMENVAFLALVVRALFAENRMGK